MSHSLTLPSFATGFAKSMSQSAYPELWHDMVAFWAAGLGPNSPTDLRDYSGNRRNLTTGASTAEYIATPKGWGLHLLTDGVSLGTLATGHGITKTWTEVIFLDHREGSAFSSTWPDFRDVWFSTDNNTNHQFKIAANTDVLSCQYWDGGGYQTATGATTLSFRSAYSIAMRLSEATNELAVFLNGNKDGSVAMTAGNSLATSTLTFHRPSSSGEWSPYSVVAHGIWNRALINEELRLLAEMPLAPLLRKQRRTFKAPAAPSGAIAAAVSLVFTASGTLTGSGALAGTAALAITGTGTLTGAGELAAAGTMAFTGSGTLTGAGALAAAATIAFTGSGTLAGPGAMTAAASLAITTAGDLTGSGALAAAASMAFTAAGALVDNTEGAMAAVAPLAITASGTLTGVGTLAAAASMVFAGTGTLTGAGVLAGAAALVFTGSGTFSTPGDMFGLAQMVFGASATLTTFIPDHPGMFWQREAGPMFWQRENGPMLWTSENTD